MEIALNPDDAIPAFARAWIGSDVSELIAQIKGAVRRGDLRPGDPLPSVRQLANDLELTRETVTKVYRLLQHDAVIERRRYSGFVVHSDVKNGGRADTA